MYNKVDNVMRTLIKVLLAIVGIVIFYIGYNFIDDRYSGSVAQDTEISFSDIEGKSQDINIAKWAVENNIVRGYLDGSFRPDELISEKQMMIMLYSYFGLGDLKYITTMIDESNIEVKNVGEVYGKLRDAGIFVEGTNVLDGSVLVREEDMTIREVLVNLSKFFGSDETSYSDFKLLQERVSDDNRDIGDKITKIEFLELLYVLDKNRDEYSNEIIVNKKISMEDIVWFSDDKGTDKFMMIDKSSGMLITLDVFDKGYDVSVLNSGSTPYEYFGYSVITYGDSGVSSVFDTENYVALGGTSVVRTRVDGNGIDLIVVVLGDQVVEIPLERVLTLKKMHTGKKGVFNFEGDELNRKDYEYIIQNIYSGM